MTQPVSIERFGLERHAGPYEAWPTVSRLIVDGKRSEVALPGYQLLHQFETAAGYLLVTDFDCPYEEMTNFVLLNRDLRLLAGRSIGAMYSSFLLDRLEWTGPTSLTATFHRDACFGIALKAPRFPFRQWRISVTALG